ncbi:hypothetical protein [Streptomyces sp. NPDC001843]|uniref:hypothetical protein n=1 Tax=Streptomyces sp. NPDC001843 TaxID=3364617 RepID=UPI0036973682
MTVLTADAEPVTTTSYRDVPGARTRDLAHTAPAPLPARHVPLAGAAGLTLADGGLRTDQPLPGFDTAAMDGYAVGPGPGPWRLLGAVRAGTAWTNRRVSQGHSSSRRQPAPGVSLR